MTATPTKFRMNRLSHRRLRKGARKDTDRDFFNDYGKLIVVVAIIAIILVAGIPPILDQLTRKAALEYQRSEAKEEFLAALSDRDELIEDVSRISESPLPISPPPGVHIFSPLVEFRWLGSPEEARAPMRIPQTIPSSPTTPKDLQTDYLIEITRLDLPGKPMPQYAYASNPDGRSDHKYLDPGQYIWRVASEPVTVDMPRLDVWAKQQLPHGQANPVRWSGFSTFVVESTKNQDSAPRSLVIGINFVQQSVFMTRSSSGQYSGFDADLVNWIAEHLHRTPKWSEYASVSTLLNAARRGYVDVAIGSLTRTAKRERGGNAFTQGYLRSHLVITCFAKDPSCAARFDDLYHNLVDEQVGVIEGTTNHDAAKELQDTFGFILKPLPSFESLMNALETRSIKYALVDEPFVHRRCQVASDLNCFQLPISMLKRYYADVGHQGSEEYAIAADNAWLREQVNGLLLAPQGRQFVSCLTKKYLSANDFNYIVCK